MDSHSGGVRAWGRLGQTLRAVVLGILFCASSPAQNVIATIAGSPKVLPDGVLSPAAEIGRAHV